MTAANFNISQIAQRAVAAQVEARYAANGSTPKDYVPLTPESLLTFCQTRLRDLDEQISKRMEQQRTMMHVQGAVGDLKQAIAGHASFGCKPDGFPKDEKDITGDDVDGVRKGNEAFDSAIHEAKQAGDYATAKKLEDLKAVWNKSGDAIVTKDEMSGINKSLDTILSDMSSNSEIQMIEMQSLISKRSTALQLTTNMMNSMNESQKAIAGNIGR